MAPASIPFLMNHSAQILKGKVIAILGYGNQGRSHALNLRDSNYQVVLGARKGKGALQAKKDGFLTLSLKEAFLKSDIALFLLPDEIIPEVYLELLPILKRENKAIGFCHGFAYTFKLIEILANRDYFLVGPKGAGIILRENYLNKTGLPGVWAIHGKKNSVKKLALQYAKAIGLHSLIETTFEEETKCDLFGEQAVLCGGILQLMEASFETLVKNKMSKEMAFFECCFEAKTILDLWMKMGPEKLSNSISPTAFYGGLTRGKRIVTSATRKELQKIFNEIDSGKFATEWLKEVRKGKPKLKSETRRLKKCKMNSTFKKLINDKI